MKRRFWKKEEVLRLIRLYPDTPTANLAKLFGCSLDRVYQKANTMGLKKSQEYMKDELERQADRLREIGPATRYLKGATPHNKGKKMAPEVYEKVKHSFFPKGNEPHNTNYDGHERVSKDGYVEVRIRKGKYRLKHLHLWERKNGKLPKGHCLTCLDGNKLNTDPSNWQMISRADNMRRNTFHRYPPEVKELIRLQGKLKRKIKTLEQDEK